MFGKNPLRKVERGDGMTLTVHSMFYTLQGEGPFSGQPAVFIRLAGCNLACTFCDTEFEVGASVHDVEDIAEWVQKSHPEGACNLVVITGGEPLRQNIAPLIERLLLRKYTVQIETAGTVWQDSLDPLIAKYARSRLVFVCSPKTGKVHEKLRSVCDDWKYIIRRREVSDEDGLPIASTQQEDRHALLFRATAATDRIWLQPMDEYDLMPNGAVPKMVENRKKTRDNMAACAEIAMRYGYRVTLQTHKILELP